MEEDTRKIKHEYNRVFEYSSFLTKERILRGIEDEEQKSREKLRRKEEKRNREDEVARKEERKSFEEKNKQRKRNDDLVKKNNDLVIENSAMNWKIVQNKMK